jgi:uncharacterized protein YjdB
MCAACGGKRAEGGVRTLVMHPSSKELTLGLPFRAAASLSVEIRPSDAPVRLEWSSSDEQIAVVDANGVVEALSPGTARITVRDADSGKKDTCTLRVRTVPQAISIRINSAELLVGRTISLSPRLSPAADIPKIYKGITWSSSDGGVATVDARGRVTAVGSGTAEITGTTTNGLTAVCVVTVP